MELWKKVWREGIDPQLSMRALEALRRALLADDPRMLQGATTSPPPSQCVQDWPVEAACALAYGGWQGEGLRTVAEVESYFAKLCYEAEKRLGSDGGMVRHFLEWFDDTPRPEMRRALLDEIQQSLERRGVDSNCPGTGEPYSAPTPAPAPDL